MFSTLFFFVLLKFLVVTLCDEVFIKQYEHGSQRSFSNFAGKVGGRWNESLPKPECEILCGCLGYQYAAVQNFYCFCGESYSSSLTVDKATCELTDCILVLRSNSILPRLPTIHSTETTTFNQTDLHRSTTIRDLFFSRSGKISEHSVSKVIPLLFASVNADATVAAFTGEATCRPTGPPVHIQVWVRPSVQLTCPPYVNVGSNYTCSCLATGSELQRATLGRNGVNTIVEDSNATSLHYSTGANLIDQRFSYRSPAHTEAAFININHYFRYSANILGFEANFLKTGKIGFMILKPVCEKGYAYIRGEGICDSEANSSYNWTTAFISNNENSSSFNMNQQKFSKVSSVMFSPMDMSENHMKAEFVVRHQWVMEATAVGAVVLPVGGSTSYLQQGDVLGFYEIDARVKSYRTLQEYSFPEYTYQVSTTYRGAKFPVLEDQDYVGDTHMVRAYVSLPSWYVQEYESESDVELNNVHECSMSARGISLPLTSAATVSVVNSLQGLVIGGKDLVEDIEEEYSMTFELDDEGTGDVTYCIQWGDKNNFIDDTSEVCDVETKEKEILHQWPLTVNGETSVRVTASDGLSTITESKRIILPDMSCSTLLPLVPLPTKQPHQIQPIHLLCKGVSLVKVSYQVNMEYRTQSPLAFSEPHPNQIKLSPSTYVYFIFELDQPGNYYYNLTLHSLSSEIIFLLHGILLHPIGNFTIVRDGYNATNATNVFGVTEHSGMNVTYVWTWHKDNVTTTNVVYNNGTIEHTFERYGNWSCMVNATNAVSSFGISFPITIEDIISAVEFLDEPYFVQFNESSRTMLQIERGSGVDLYINHTSQLSPFVYDFDVSDDISLIGATYHFQNPGYYNISAFFNNGVSNYAVWTMVPVEFGIRGLNLTLTQEEIGGTKDYIEVNERLQVNVTLTSQGEFTYFYDLGNGSNVTSEQSFLAFSYLSWSTNPPFIFTVIVSTFLSSANISIPIPVQMPVLPLTGFNLLTKPLNSTIEDGIKLRIDGGNEFTCFWNFSDGSDVRVVSYEEFVNNSGWVNHLFGRPGRYEVYVKCENRLFSTNTSASLHAYTPLSTFTISTAYMCQGEEEKLGLGEENDIFPLNCDVVFNIEDQEGSNVSYVYDFGYEEDGKRKSALQYDQYSAEGTTLHRFPSLSNNKNENTGIYEYTVTVLASNSIGSLETSLVVKLMSSPNNFSLAIDRSNVTLGDTFSVLTKIYGLNDQTCYVLEYSRRGEDPIYPRYVFGHAGCRRKLEYQFDMYTEIEMVANTFFPIRSFYFDVSAVYMFSVTATNTVSSHTKTISINVLHAPCFPPKATWDSAMATAANDAEAEAPLYKCRRHNILVDVFPNCLISNSSVQTGWYLQRVLDDKGKDVVDDVVPTHNLVASVSSKRFVLTPRLLNYGTYLIRFNASMVVKSEQNKTEVVEETQAVLDGYFLIKQCDIRAEIVGGTGKAVFHKGPIVINGSASLDPDTDPAEDMMLRFKWFCKRKGGEEQITLKNDNMIDYPDAPLTEETGRFKGCFGNGHGQLSNHHNPILILNGKFMKIMHTYMIWMQVTKAKRKHSIVKYELKVIDAEPPLVDIECKLNCGPKVNPSQKLSLVASCTNCKKRPIYSWEMFKKRDDSEEFVISDTDTLRRFAHTNISRDQNLVVKAHALSPKYMYLVKLNAYWSLSDDDISRRGFAMYTLFVNSPPVIKAKHHNHFCSVSPHIGIALQTEFHIECNKSLVGEKDLPLEYFWSYQTKDGIWKSVTFPSSGNPKSKSFLLTAGRADENYHVNISIVVRDTFGADSHPIFISAIVTPSGEPLTTEKILSILSLPKYKEPAALGNIATNLFDSMDKRYVDINTVNSKIMELTLNVEVNSPAAASMVLDNLDGGSDENAALSDQSLDNSLTLADNVANFAEEMTPDDISSAGSKMLSATGKFTSGLSGDPFVAADKLAFAMKNEAKFTSGMATNMIAGEPAARILTSNGVSKVSCVDPKSDNSPIDGFSLPKSLGSDLADGACTGASNSVGKNRYGFKGKSKYAVHGDTLGLGLSSGLGKKKVVENLTERIRLVIPNKNPPVTAKSYSAYCNLMLNIHLVPCSVNESAIIILVKPKLGPNSNMTGPVNFFVFMNKGVAPSLSDPDQNCTLPNPYPINWRSLSAEKRTFFEQHERWRCFFDQKRLDGLAIGRWCVGVIYFTNTTNQTSQLLQRSTPESEIGCEKLNYSFTAYTRACLYWDGEEKTWSGQGCETSTQTNDNETICFCDHLTDFGGGGPPPSEKEIDFRTGFAISASGDNPTVFSICIFLIILLFPLLFLAHRQDIRVNEKRRAVNVEDNYIRDNYWYSLSIQTGYTAYSSTTANVFITLKGNDGTSFPRHLFNPRTETFGRGEKNTFLLSFPYGFGDLNGIEIWHDNSGSSPGWFLIQVQIEDLGTKRIYKFFCNEWLDAAEGDGMIRRYINVSNNLNNEEFDSIMSRLLRRTCFDEHLWLSIFTRPLETTFTSVQRLCTCFCFLTTIMLSNIMFYTNSENESTLHVKLGPVSVHVVDVKTGVLSTLITLLPNLLIISLFKLASENHGSKSSKYLSLHNVDRGSEEVKKEKRKETEEEGREEEDKNDFRRFLHMLLSQEGKREVSLPNWFTYVAYAMCGIISFISLIFVIWYGLDFGRKKSEQWVISMLISLIFSIFVVEAIKVVVVAFLYAMLYPETLDEVINVDKHAMHKNVLPGLVLFNLNESEGRSQKRQKIMFKVPSTRDLKEFRTRRVKEKQIKTIMKEIFVHTLFVLLVQLVCKASEDQNSFLLQENARIFMGQNAVTKSYFDNKAYRMDNKKVSFLTPEREIVEPENIINRLQWLDWARYSVTEYLFPPGWYNNRPVPKNYIADNSASKVLAMARLRQVRIKLSPTCEKHPVFKHLITECNAEYSGSEEATSSHSAGWHPPLNITLRYALRRGKRKSLWKGLEDGWLYQDEKDIQALPYAGRFATYSGSSYSVSIGPKKRVSKIIIGNLREYFWIDRYTRALFVEANIYNANTNLLCIVTMLHEIIPTGGWSFFYNIQSLKLYRYVGGMGDVVVLFDIIFLLATFVGWYKVLKAARNDGFLRYITNFWYLLHLVVTFCSTLSIVLFIIRVLFVKWTVEDYNDSPELFTSFVYIGIMENVIMGCLGFVTFFTTLEFLRVLRFNQTIGTLLKTVGSLAKPLASFFIAFCIIYMAYVSFSHCLLADKLEGYRSVKQSFITLLLMFMGQFDLMEFLMNAPVFGPLLFFTYMIVITMILINLFVGIICDAFAAAEEDEEDEDEDSASFFPLMFNAINNIRMKKAVFGADPIYTEWKSKWPMMMENFEEQTDNCLYLMHSMEIEIIRQEQWMDTNTLNKELWCILLAVFTSEAIENEADIFDGTIEMKEYLNSLTAQQCQQLLRAALRKHRSKQKSYVENSLCEDKKEPENSSVEESVKSLDISADIQFLLSQSSIETNIGSDPDEEIDHSDTSSTDVTSAT